MPKKNSLDKNGFLASMSPKKNIANLFITVVAVSAAIYTVIAMIVGNGRFSDIFFIRCADFYMDFFNSIRDAAQGSGVYTERGVIYPPMANLIYLILSRFTPSVYNDTSFAERYSWPEYFSSMMLVVAFTAACALVYFFIVYSSVKYGSRLRRFAFAFFAFFSVPVLYLVERGNIIFITLIALMIYAVTYNSECKYRRELGLICLAFAFSIKLYPVVFGWFLLADKRFKDAARCALYGLAMLIVPSFFFGGPICFYHVFLNIFDFSAGSGNTLSVILNYVGMPSVGQSIFTALVYAWVLICGCSFAVSPFIRKEKPWKTWAVGLVTILCVPSLTSIYSWAFFIIPLIMICNRVKNCDKRDITYAVMMIIPFAFLPFRITFHVSPNMVLVYIMTAVLSIYAVVDTARDLCAFVADKKAQGVGFGEYMKSLVKND